VAHCEHLSQVVFEARDISRSVQVTATTLNDGMNQHGGSSFAASDEANMRPLPCGFVCTKVDVPGVKIGLREHTEYHLIISALRVRRATMTGHVGADCPRSRALADAAELVGAGFDKKPRAKGARRCGLCSMEVEAGQFGT
jgi:hypothetical protein